jgi:hypothetical protein
LLITPEPGWRACFGIFARLTGPEFPEKALKNKGLSGFTSGRAQAGLSWSIAGRDVRKPVIILKKGLINSAKRHGERKRDDQPV